MNCVNCGALMRGQRQSAVDYPGTVIHRARGLCSRCYEKKSHHKKLVEPESDPLRDLTIDQQTVLYALMRNLRGEELDRISSMLGLDADSRPMSVDRSLVLSPISPMGSRL